MKASIFKATILLLTIGLWMGGSATLAASPSPALLKAKKEAEAKGFIFETSHDEIVAKAKKEGKLRVLSSQEESAIQATAKAFKKKYPFIDVQAAEISGVGTYLGMLQEMRAGLADSWDVNYVAFDFYEEYVPFQKKFDILGMAQHGVLKMPVKLVDPANRQMVALQTNMQVVGYNKKLISVDKVPNTWEDFLKPAYKGRKFVLDIRPKDVAALVPAWGLERTLGFAKKLAAQEPIWARGNTRVLTAMSAGEYALHFGPNYKSVLRVGARDPSGSIKHKVLEPVPVRLTEAEAILGTAKNPYAALLWLEFQGSPEGQKILDKKDLAASMYSPGSAHEKATRGKKLSLMAWEHYPKMAVYQKKIVKAYGFPMAERRKR